MGRLSTTTTTGAVLVVLLVTAGCALDATAPPRPVAEVVEGPPDCALSTDAWIVPEPGAAPTAAGPHASRRPGRTTSTGCSPPSPCPMRPAARACAPPTWRSCPTSG